MSFNTVGAPVRDASRAVTRNNFATAEAPAAPLTT